MLLSPSSATQMKDQHATDTERPSGGLSSLPLELLFHILTFLPAQDIIDFLSTARSFHALASNESVWQELCSRYGLHDLAPFRIHDPNRSFFTVYTKLLHPYGPLLGLWASDNPFLGSVLEFRILTAEESKKGKWEGIICEVWRFWKPSESDDEGDDEDEDDEQELLLPDYYETLRIQLLPPDPPGYEPPALQPSYDGRFLIPVRHNGTKVTWAIHNEFGENDPAIYRDSLDEPIRLNCAHEQEFYIRNTPPDSDVKPSLHPPFPPPFLELHPPNDELRFPRFDEIEEEPLDHTEFLARFPWNDGADWRVFYAKPIDQEEPTTPQSISILPPFTVRLSERFWQVVQPFRRSGITDVRQDLNNQFSMWSPDPEEIPFKSHFFPIPSSPSSSSPSSSSNNLTVTEHDLEWTPQDLDGVWLCMYPRDDVQVVYLKWEEASSEVQAWKLTGDLHVPRGAVGWQFSTTAELDVAEYKQMLREMVIEVGSSPTLKIYEGSGVVAELGFLDATRKTIPLWAVVTSRDSISLRRYPGRDVSSEDQIHAGLRRSYAWDSEWDSESEKDATE
ncbi:F-box protein 31 [Steccherinum ochraceum]|uniref:F-box protein 31 n=1 Tax=Steccherinum ochraceum TaxID=92696 RepID=A0A4R0RHC6_9APHY|nr:F-box protein 31 [Steccherinum ochraceum]